MRTQTKALFFASTAMLAAVGGPGVILAQTVPSTAAPPSADASLAEVVVTARKTNERIEDVPLSITAFNTKELRTAAPRGSRTSRA